MSQMCPNCSFDNLASAKNCSQCGMPLRYLLGQNALLSNRYKLVSVLGCGAMGAVYLAEDTRLVGRRCAIKENLPDPHAPVNVQERSREQFLAEASVLARLDHPNLPKVSDYFIEDSREYLVMDYVEGEDLESRLERTKQPLDEKAVVGWADQVLDALAYLHNQRPQPIIHRDIKPANLRIDLYNRVKLVDFGLVKLFDAASPETKAELRGVGTPAYAPIEQFAGSDEHTDSRSDIYSLGATLYHLLTNSPPIEVHRRLLKPETLPKPSALNPQISAGLEQVILKSIAIYPDDRYQTALEMRQALSQPAVPVAPAVTPPPPATPARKKRLALPVLLGLVGLILVLALLGVAAYALLSNRPPTPERPSAAAQALQPEITPLMFPTVTPTATASPTPVVVSSPTPTPTLTATITPTVTPLPSQPVKTAAPAKIPAASLVGTIAYPVFNGKSYDLYFGQADGSGTKFFRADASQPAFNADGSRLAFHSWNSSSRGLVVSAVAGGNGVLVSNFVEDQLPTWSADGSQIYLLSRRTGSRKSELYRVNSAVERGPVTYVGEGEYPAIGATGQLAFRGWGNTGNGLRLASPTLENIRVVTDNSQDTAPALSPDGSQVAFMSQRDGNWEVYVIKADGTGLQRLTTDPAEDGLPAWSPDGQVLAFLSNRSGKWAMWATTPAGDTQQQLFECQGSPDGFVGTDTSTSRGWAEERLSWMR